MPCRRHYYRRAILLLIIAAGHGVLVDRSENRNVPRLITRRELTDRAIRVRDVEKCVCAVHEYCS